MFSIEGMEGFLGDTNGLRNLPLSQKTKLFRRDGFVKVWLESQSNNFGYKLVDRLHREIGLMSRKDRGLYFLGIREIKVEFRA